MKAVKSKKKQYELAKVGNLWFVQDGKYRLANVGMVVTLHGTMNFYEKVR